MKRLDTRPSFNMSQTELASVPLTSCYFATTQNVDSPQARFILPMV